MILRQSLTPVWVILIFICLSSQVVPSTSQSYSSGEEEEEASIPQGAASLAFVFDTTGSMYDDLVQVIEGAARILAVTLARREKPLYNYVLVPFHDPDVGPAEVTTDPEQYQRDLRDLYVQGGGDCPEMSVGAIKLALEVSLPNSFIYVFTDARAKDYVLTESVLTLIQQKQSQVLFVMTGDCGNTSHPGYKAYEQIASTSSGQIFILKKSQVDQVLTWVQQAVQSRKVNLLSIDKSISNTLYYDLPVDSKLQEFTIAISGHNPTISVLDPKGKKINKKNGMDVVLDIKNVKVVSFKDPKPGLWKLEVGAEDTHTIRITGVSSLDFAHGFSRHPTLDLEETSGRPIKGIRTSLLINATDLYPPGQISRVELVNLNGDVLMQVPAVYYPDRPAVYNMSQFVPPDDFFFVKAVGTDNLGYDFQRTTPTAISPIPPEAPIIYMPSVTRGYYDETARIVCSVSSLVPFEVQFFKDGQRLGTKLFFSETGNATWEVPQASSFSEGVYKCNATNAAGWSEGQTLLDVKDPPPIVEPPHNVSVIPGNSALLSCAASSTVTFNWTWFRVIDGVEQNMRDLGKARVFNNGSMLVRNVQEHDEGPYICRASNEGGHTDAYPWLLLQRIPIVTPIPSTQNFVTGATATIRCTSLAHPPPTYVWRRFGEIIPLTDRVHYDTQGKITLRDLKRSEEGEYECVATNSAGTASGFAHLNYIEAPKIRLAKKRVLVNNGETAVLICDTDGIPQPNITWYKENIELQQQPYVQITENGELHILGTQEFDAGNYQCLATNEAGSDTGTILLQVGATPIITESPTSIGVDVLTSATLPCSAIGVPPPKILWRRADNKYIEFGGRFKQLPSGALHITEIHKEDEGMYTCSAQNQFGSQEVSAFITVTGVVRPLLPYMNPLIQTTIGRTVRLQCRVLLGNPPPKIMWFKMGELVQSTNRIDNDGNGNIIIDAVELKDEGEYKCVASNVGGNASNTVTLDVQIPPYIIDDGERDFTVSMGNSIRLPCKVSGDPPPEITWTKNGKLITDTDPHYFINEEGSLEIFSADPDDTATYSCTAMNVAGVQEKRMTLFVQIPPQIDQTDTHYTVVVNNPVQLPCEATGTPIPDVAWYRQGKQLNKAQRGHIILPNGGLRLNHAQLEDAGMYECVAVSEAGNATKLITLTVQVPPRIISDGPTTITVLVGEQVTLGCEAVGDPHPVITWKKDSAEIDFFDRHIKYQREESGNLYIDRAEVSDAARYLCMAENPAGVVTRELHLIVHEAPRLPYGLPKNATIIEGNGVNLPCPAEGTPNPRITWYKHDIVLTGNEIGVRILSDGSLQLDRAESADSGAYTCVAENVAGNQSHSTNLTVYVLPHFPGGDPNGGGQLMEESKTVIENDTVVITCPANAVPPPQITWYKDGREMREGQLEPRIRILEAGKFLEIRRAQVGDTALYKCVASNLVGENQKDTKLQVLVPPSIDDNDASDRNLSVIVDHPLIIMCPAEGIPQATITWYKDDIEIETEFNPTIRVSRGGRRLEILRADISDTGDYRCEAVNPAGEAEKDYTVHVWVPAQIDNSEVVSNLEVVENKTLTIICPASGIPLPGIEWYIGNDVLYNSSRFTILDGGFKLVITDVKVSDVSRYRCRAVNLAGNAEKYYDVDVLVPPKIDREGLDQNPQVVENRTIVINCPVSGNPPPEIVWLRNEQLMDPNRYRNMQVLAGGRQLRIANAQVGDTATYRCDVTNKAGKDHQNFGLEVLVPTWIDRAGLFLTPKVFENQTQLLDCPAFGIPIPDISWYKDGDRVESGFRIQTLQEGRQLKITKAIVEDTGYYECKATNLAGSDSLSYDLEVYVPPFIDHVASTESNPQVIINQTAILDCVVYGVPKPTVRWLVNGRPLEGIRDSRLRLLGENRQLEIRDANVPDTARYTCIASSDAGVADRDFDLDVLVPPYIDGTNIETEPRVIKGKDIVLDCPAMGIPFPNVTWLVDGQPLVTGYRVQILRGGRQLKIFDAEELDTARYTCVAMNIAGQARRGYDLHVWVPPTIDDANIVENPKIIKGRTVLLECPVSGTPEPEVHWMMNMQPLVLNDRMRLRSNGRQLEIRATEEEDTAHYTCVATNDAGELQRNFDLGVLVPPTIGGPEQEDLEGVENSTIYLKCPSEGIPPPSVLWFRDQEPLLDFPYHNIRELANGRQLELRNIQVSDEGRYACEVGNVAGKARKNFYLNVHVPPRIPGSRVPTELSVIVRDRVTMECEPTGDPEPEITWFKDGKPLAKKGRHLRVMRGGKLLQVLGAAVKDGGSYMCVAKNVAGDDRRLFNLQVWVPPRINGSHSLEQLTVVMGNSITMECPTTGVPEPSIQWIQNGGRSLSFRTDPNLRMLNGGHRLQILSADLIHMGGYKCVASNVAGNDSKDFLLDVHVPPTIDEGPTQVAAIANSRTQLFCEARGSPDPVVSWTKDGYSIPTNGVNYRMHRTGTLEFSSMRVEDTGEYRCEATNVAGNASRTIELFVQVPPRMENRGPLRLQVKEGEVIELPCEATGVPPPTITWQKGTRQLKESQGYKLLKDGSFLIKEAQLHDGGIYVCVAHNEAGSKLQQVRLEVQVPPVIEEGQSEFTVVQEREVVFPCKATGLPLPKITWEKDGREIRLNDFRYRVMKSGYLAIPIATMDDAGTFTCIAENNAGRTSIVLDLSVHVPPSIEESDRLLTVTEGDTADLYCKSGGLPYPEIKWIHDGRNVIASGRRHKVHDDGGLTIYNVESEDGGSYVCTATNEAGRDKKEVVLRVQVPPSIVVYPQDQEVTASGRIQLECEATGVPVPVISWRLNQTDYASPPSVNGRSRLLIDDAKSSDDGTYMCVAENPAGSIQAVAAVRVKVPPRVLIDDIAPVTLPGGMALLNCPVEGGYPPPTIIWTKGGSEVVLGGRIEQLTNGSLRIYDTNSADSGDYKCVATNEAGTSEGIATLTVKSPAKIVIEPRSLTVVQGENAQMDCKAEGEPEPDITWHGGGEVLHTRDRITILPSNSLRIVATQLSDTGEYICYVNNSLGKELVKATLTVQVNGAWSLWSSWSDCSVSCGQGDRFRTRICNNPEPANGGRTCRGNAKQTRSCMPANCPIPGSWAEWSSWEQCSRSCGHGERTRIRQCNNPPPRYGGRSCLGDPAEKLPCNTRPCPVDGGWGDWSVWQPCSEVCGEGTQERYRRCDTPRPQHGGEDCFGSDTERKSCKVRDCETDGSWGGWSSWTSCTLSCGGGTRTRKRGCDSPPPSNGGRFCPGIDKQIDYCNKDSCPIHGNWAEWSEWGDCTMTCGGGQRRRFRTCTNPPPKHNGRACIGPSQTTEECNTIECAVDGEWSPWGDWTSCTKTCGGGMKQRFRMCQRPRFGGDRCPGDDTQLKKCNKRPCTAGLPRWAIGNVIGNVNNHEFGIAKLVTNITRSGRGTKNHGVLTDIPGSTGKFLQHLVSILSPIYWTTATEVLEAVNGYTLTEGNFRRTVHLSFATGQTLSMMHVARGLDRDGILQVDIIIDGEVPRLPDRAKIIVMPFVEDYIQTGPGEIYAFSSRLLRVDGHSLPYATNHTITYDVAYGRMPYLVERLTTDDVFVEFDINEEILQYQLTASIAKGEPSNQCPKGFYLDPEGPYCKDDDECTRLNPCSHYCQNMAGSFSCSCPPGLSLASDGRICKDQDECSEASICSHVCLNTMGSFKCTCRQGWSLHTDGKTCSDIDECELGLATCHRDQECLNTIGSYKCAIRCESGYRRSAGGHGCEDINECRESRGICDQNCVNTAGSYYCQCEKGFRLEGKNKCRDINECRDGSHTCSHRCRNLPGSYECSCPVGYRLQGTGRCRDIDECMEGKHDCRAGQDCRNTQGGYQCVNACPQGFQKAPNGTCVDIDECRASQHNCHYNQICINTPGAFRCSCPRGYRPDGSNRPCVDLNECAQSPSPCSYQCHNTQGGYHCSCAPGQKLLSDKKSCAGLQYLPRGDWQGTEADPPLREYCRPGQPCQAPNTDPALCPQGYRFKTGKCIDVDECEENVKCQHGCQNTPGSFRCLCPSGYRLAANGRQCRDIDECKELNIDCGADKTCFNRRGDFVCLDTPCPDKYERDPGTGYCVLRCTDADEECPPGARYADILEFRLLALPSGIPAYQDLIRLVAYDHEDVHLYRTTFTIIENDKVVPFGIRLEKGKGVVYTLKPLEEKKQYRIKVRAESYDHRRRDIKYKTSFLIFISVSPYPY